MTKIKQQDKIFYETGEDHEENLTQTNSFELTKSSSDGFSQYLQEIQKFPILSAQEEYEYAMKFKNDGDKEAAKILVQSHLRLVVKIAGKFRNYGLPITDLVSEGNLGLIKAVKKFDPQKGFRFSTYAMWWIKAGIQEHILRSWSLVKIGTTIAQKKLFFNLNKIKRRLLNEGENELSDVNIKRISDDLNVSQKEVQEMDLRLTKSDCSLNTFDENGNEIGEIVIADEDLIENKIIKNQERENHEALIREAFLVLNEREKDILIKRQMSEISMTLEDLSKIYKISRERIRQLEQNALEKIKKEILRLQQK
ncbi:MAG TPA: RNA polymerase factor sigma-32 [Rickettsiales bacterium]|nr:RNA polymerase factor sigma-32 [Rickettsiales bacterium]